MTGRVAPWDRLMLFFVAWASLHTISPVADLLMVDSKLIYSLLLVLFAVYLGLRPRAGIDRGPSGPTEQLVAAGFIALAVFCAAHAWLYPAGLASNLKYLLLLLVGWLMFFRMEWPLMDALLRGLAVFFSLYTVYAGVVYTLIYTGFVERADWSLDLLRFLGDSNAMKVVAGPAPDQMYMPFYSVTIPRPLDLAIIGPVRFSRLTGLFMEPTDIAFVVAPLFFYCLDLARSGQRRYFVCAALLLAQIAWAFSVAGFLAVTVAVIVHRICAADNRNTLPRRALRGAMASCLIGALAAMLLWPDLVIPWFGASKEVQLKTFEGLLSRYSNFYLNPSLFGVGFLVGGFQGYGLTSVLVRQGVLGAAALFMFLCPFVLLAWRLSRDPRRLLGPMAICSGILFLKIPEITNLYFMIIYIAAIRAGLRSGI